MALAAIIKEETYNGLSDQLKPEYKKQEDGTYLLDVTPIDGFALEDVKGLKSSLGAARSERDAAQAQLRNFGDLDPNKAREALKKIEDMAKWEPEEKVKEQIEAIKAQLTDKHKTELDKKHEELANLTKQLEQVMIDELATKEIVAQGGIKTSPTVLLPYIRGITRMRQVDGKFVSEVVGADGNARISPATNSTGTMTIAELITEMKGQEAFSPLFNGSGATGSGATGSNTQRTGGRVNLEELAKLPPAQRMQRAQELGIKT